MKIFLWVLNNSITASLMIIAVIILRYLMGKKANRIMCVLWGVVLIRIMCPFYIHSRFAFLDSSWKLAASEENTINSTESYHDVLQTESIIDNNEESISIYNENLNLVKSNDDFLHMAIVVWITGMIILVSAGIVKCFKIRRIISVSLRSEDVLICDNINEAFVFGLFNPVICIPSSMDGKYISPVINHERTHIKRKYNLKKFLWCFALIVYWFDPMVWAAFSFFERDLEIACDIQTIKGWEANELKNYIDALLYFSQYKHTVFRYKSHFSSSKIKERIFTMIKPPKKFFMILTVFGGVIISVIFFTMNNDHIQNNIANANETYANIDEQIASGSDHTEKKMTDAEIEENYYPEGYIGYHYASLPQMSNWPYGNHQWMINICQIPEEILYELSTEELFQTIAAYPLWGDIYAYDSFEAGFEIIKEHFNGLNELYKREDLPSVYDKMSDLLERKYPTAISMMGRFLYNNAYFR